MAAIRTSAADRPNLGFAILFRDLGLFIRAVRSWLELSDRCAEEGTVGAGEVKPYVPAGEHHRGGKGDVGRHAVWRGWRRDQRLDAAIDDLVIFGIERDPAD